jgi:hypothetical protein
MPNKDLRELREKLEKHLEESGEIRNDLQWLKKSFWTLAGGVLTLNISVVASIIIYLLRIK